MDLSEVKHTELHSNDETEKPPQTNTLTPDQIGKKWAWAFRITWLVLIGAVYIIGYLFRTGYFSLFHLDAGSFPLATPEYFVRGGYAIYLTASSILNVEGNGAWQVIGITVICTISMGAYLAAVSFIIEWLSTIIIKDKNINRTAEKIKLTLNKRFLKKFPVKLGIGGIVAVAVGAYFFVAICMISVFLYAIPSAIANAAAERQYRTELTYFGNGCKDPRARYFCFSVQDSSGSTIARGFMIAAAPDYVALSDDGRTRLVSLLGRQLVQLDMPLKE
ncbi:hypothetical protein [Burkholderia sp. AU38729]|uniref:hypothetical protein n=1 Tax=Burkholderia sp. AU38729 TaxID=2879633 RepID=UPI001CF40783|nr:hypothetical protein [Burkholderia sp. AU38729]MCA8061391.1 hypothetical protein [Burkholderia sp. AU38729]